MLKSFYNHKLPLKILFLLGALLGALVFIGIYGVRVLDFTNDGWLFYYDNDLRQHYIAWCNYRNDPWHFPIGLIDSLSYPNSVSVIYTDSIPIFAVFFKIISFILPSTFQYFGLWGIICFALMGGLATVLIARFTDDNIVILLGSVFFSCSFQMVHRIFYHSALAAQWIIILALIIWVYDREIKGFYKKILIWAMMGFLCVAIHSYFLPMVGMIMLSLVICQFVNSKKQGKSIWQSLLLPLCEFLGFCIMGIINLYVLGAFYGKSSPSGFGLGTFGANLNTFINPIHFGRVFKSLSLYTDFQYEGFGYVGAGIIYLYICIAMGLIIRRIRKAPEVAFHSTKLYGKITMFLLLCSWFFATYPLFSFNDKKIVWLPCPQIVEKVLGIFRSNGRLIWVATYILVLSAIIITAYTFREDRIIGIVLIALALFVQIYDGSLNYVEKHKYFTTDYPIYNLWNDPELTTITEGKEEFIFLYNNNDITLDTAYFASNHGMRQNNYYYARNIDEEVNANIEENIKEVASGKLKEGAVYIVTDEMYYSDQDFYNSIEGKKVHKYDHFYFTTE